MQGLLRHLGRTGNCEIRYNQIYMGLEPRDLVGKSERYLKEVQGRVHRIIPNPNRIVQATFSLRRDMTPDEMGYFNGLDFSPLGLSFDEVPEEEKALWNDFRKNVGNYFARR